MTGTPVESIHHRATSCRCPNCLRTSINARPDYKDGYYPRIGQWADAAIALRRSVPAPIALVPAMTPSGMWQVNLRFLLSGAEWDYVRLALLDDAGNRCEICGQAHATATPLECHELFTWDEDAGVARLSRILVLCRLCHLANHLGLASIIDQLDEVLTHITEVNDWYMADVEVALTTATLDWERRKSLVWTGDFTPIRLVPDTVRLEAAARRAAAKRKEIAQSR